MQIERSLDQRTEYRRKGALAAIDEASRQLARATSFEEISAIRSKAEAARTLAKAAKLGLELQNRAAEVKLLAERRAGAFLAELRLRGGDRKSKAQRATLKLEDLGVTRDQSTRWQRIAKVAEDDFCRYLAESKGEEQEITSAGLLRQFEPRIRKGRLNRKAAKASRRAVNGASKGNAILELTSELQNHSQLLSDVLRPIYEGHGAEFKIAERRIVQRLLNEIEELVKHLRMYQLHNDPACVDQFCRPSGVN